MENLTIRVIVVFKDDISGSYSAGGPISFLAEYQLMPSVG